MKKPLAITAYTATSALGRGAGAMLEALRRGESGLKPNDFDRAELRAFIGRVAGLEERRVGGALAAFDCRNNRLAELGLAQDGFREAVDRARSKYGPRRVAVLIGTSTSGILQTELAYRARSATGELPASFDYRHGQNLFSVTDFVRRSLRLEGPAATISTACSSSAKVFASASRYIEAGVADAAVVGGVDSLCLTTIHGFTSLQLVSDEPCRPFDAARKGMNIGEAAGYALVEKTGSDVNLVGYGESSDAHHMSTPHPEGEGALAAMRQALERGGLDPEDIDYVNAHGTATPANDRSEDRALVRLFGNRVPVSSTKSLTGHTLGAAGIIEAIVCFLALEHDLIPATANTSRLEPGLESQIVLETRSAPVHHALSNSFGFGGSNCSLVFAA
jgi:3-oxoacyl-[acyl-carrier-protein] synthase I